MVSKFGQLRPEDAGHCQCVKGIADPGATHCVSIAPGGIAKCATTDGMRSKHFVTLRNFLAKSGVNSIGLDPFNINYKRRISSLIWCKSRLRTPDHVF